ncbi:MAG: glycosyltransferase family 9 protein [Bacteroidales bacterium]|nr:glycosyltransferase family 9 protein [Bacteroidales bacterium]
MKKILVIRFSSIGDIVLTTPIIRCLKEQLKDVEIHFLTKTAFEPVLRNNPYIDKIFTIENKIDEVIADLKKESYFHIVDLHKNFRSKGVILKLKKPSSTFSKINVRKWLIVNFKINLLPELHIVDRYFQAVKKLSVKNDAKGLDYFIPKREEVNLTTIPVSHHKGYIGWVIGGKHNTKIYPEENIVEVCRKIDYPVVLLGGNEDFEKGERIKNEAGKNIFNACGKYNINQSASLVKQANKIITNDTGLMHIAAAFQKIIISLWGNTIPEFGMSPYMPGDEDKSIILEVKGLSCRPCSKLGYKKCPKKHFDCMEKINVNRLVELIGK